MVIKTPTGLFFNPIFYASAALIHYPGPSFGHTEFDCVNRAGNLAIAAFKTLLNAGNNCLFLLQRKNFSAADGNAVAAANAGILIYANKLIWNRYPYAHRFLLKDNHSSHRVCE
jgi:hypothetical protein